MTDKLNTHSEDTNSENAEVGELLEQFSQQRHAFFERKRIRGLECYIQGAKNYIGQFREGSDPEGRSFVEKIAAQLDKVMENHLADNRLQMKSSINSLHAQFREKGDRLAKKVYKIEFLTHMSRHLSKLKSRDPFFSHLKDLKLEYESVASKLERVLAFIKPNISEDIEDRLFVHMGKKSIHSLVSGQFQPEDIGLMSHISSSTPEDIAKKKLVRVLCLFISRLAFVDEQISSKQLLRYDMPPAVFNQARLRCRISSDKYQLREQFDEGLSSLLNIFEIYKTPIMHYQRSYDRVCRFVRKELAARIVEADEDYMKYMLFDMISSKGSAMFKNIINLLDQSFGRLDLDEPIRVESEKVKGNMRRELDL